MKIPQVLGFYVFCFMILQIITVLHIRLKLNFLYKKAKQLKLVPP